MGIFSWFSRWRENRRIAKARTGKYGRIVAWVEARYGTINEADYYMDVQSKFHQALDYGRSKKGEQAVAGLRKYIENERYRDLLKE
ncbi:MAG: hypothetical protein ACFE8U_10940 [Candidatus Hermodarchaeota archaeon]